MISSNYISRPSSHIPKDDRNYSILHYSDSSCSKASQLYSQLPPGRVQAVPGYLLPTWELSQTYPGAWLDVTRPPRFLQMIRQWFQCHLMAIALVSSTLGFDHPGIPVWQFPNTPRRFQPQNTLFWCLLAINKQIIQCSSCRQCTRCIMFCRYSQRRNHYSPEV